MTDHGKYQWLGGTLDDAAGEVFDKVARVLGLGYPGGPEIEQVAGSWSQVTSNQKQATSYRFPRPMIDNNSFDFSFSGLKTAVINYIKKTNLTSKNIPGIAYEFQQAIVDVLVSKTVKAAQKFKVREILLGGGVAANKLLRSQLTVYSSRLGIPVRFPPIEFCIDNGAMIASAAFFNFKPMSPEKIQAEPGLHF
jgi:N6-L-threonylcarbamoyladenine synthase